LKDCSEIPTISDSIRKKLVGNFLAKFDKVINNSSYQMTKKPEPKSMVPDQENDHQKKKKTKLTLFNSLMSLGLNLLGLDPLVQGFESDHRHRDKILKIIHQSLSVSERFFLGVCFRTPNKTSFF
jgi:hypothetical protein